MPGKKYLLPPEKPATSCGKTGPRTRSHIAILNVGINPHGHVEREPPLGNLRGLRRREPSQSAQRPRRNSNRG